MFLLDFMFMIEKTTLSIKNLICIMFFAETNGELGLLTVSYLILNIYFSSIGQQFNT